MMVMVMALGTTPIDPPIPQTPPLNACTLLTESSEASREGDVMEPEKGASLVGGQGEVGEVVVGRGQGGVGGHLVG